MQATIQGGKLRELDKCYIKIKDRTIKFRSVPDLSDTKSAQYNDEPIIGRSFPMKTYSHSENRAISVELYFYTIEQQDIQNNIADMRAIASATYPRNGLSGGAPYTPPPICKLRCGDLLADGELCVVLKSYSVKFPRDVAWDEQTYLPYTFQISTQWEVVYRSTDLPGQERIMQSGR